MLLNMQTAEILILERKALAYQKLLNECIDAIDQLSTCDPDGFEIAFMIRGVKTLSIQIPPSEKEFSLCFFISWRLRFHRLFEDTTAAVWALRRKIAV